jgi:hypothetical protein
VPLEGLSEAPEAKMLRSFIGIYRADALTTTNFAPIILVESPTVEAFKEFGEWALAVIPGRVTVTDHGNQTTVRVEVLSAFYLPIEPTDQDSPLYGLDLLNHVRKLVRKTHELKDPDNPTVKIAFDTVAVERLNPIETKEGIRVLAIKTTFETDVDPETGLFR